MKTYEIKYEPITIDKKTIDNGVIRDGYILNTK